MNKVSLEGLRSLLSININIVAIGDHFVAENIKTR